MSTLTLIESVTSLRAPCGCEISRKVHAEGPTGPSRLVPCNLHGAAKELLGALKELRRFCEEATYNPGGVLARARIAIAQAER